MRIAFPSPEFDDAVAAVCHGAAAADQAAALNYLLKENAAARDEYIARVELHARLASDKDLFTSLNAETTGVVPLAGVRALPPRGGSPVAPLRTPGWALAIAACFVLIAAGWLGTRLNRPVERKGSTTTAVAMLNQVADARWSSAEKSPLPGAPLEPGWLKLKSGLAQIVFYSGARLVIEGPAELQLVSACAAFCGIGRLVAEVPPQARGFQISTPRMEVTDLGTAFGLDVTGDQTELHVFKGAVTMASSGAAGKRTLREGAGAVIKGAAAPRFISAGRLGFTSLFALQSKSAIAEASRREQWRAAGDRLNHDPSLLVHFTFDRAEPQVWRLGNACAGGPDMTDGAIVGCRWTDGRWPMKSALEFGGVSDRIRLDVPGEFHSLTIAAWVRVQGLDRKFNSLFMCDGFGAGTVHWLIRGDGVLGLTIVGRGAGDCQIVASPPVLTLDQFGLWVHLAVVLDGSSKRVIHYINGDPVGGRALKMKPPFRVGPAELGNWNAGGVPDDNPLLIRNFSGAMDEFCLFGRALNADEIRALYSAGKPQPDSSAARP